MTFAKHPSKPPSGTKYFDAGALVQGINDCRSKLGLVAIHSNLPFWKRWVGGEGPDYSGDTSLRNAVEANADGLDALKGDVDSQAAVILELRADVAALQEAPPARPFP